MFELTEYQERNAKILHEESLVIDATAPIHVATNELRFNKELRGGVDVIWASTGGSAGIAKTIRAASNVMRFIWRNVARSWSG